MPLRDLKRELLDIEPQALKQMPWKMQLSDVLLGKAGGRGPARLAGAAGTGGSGCLRLNTAAHGGKVLNTMSLSVQDLQRAAEAEACQAQQAQAQAQAGDVAGAGEEGAMAMPAADPKHVCSLLHCAFPGSAPGSVLRRAIGGFLAELTGRQEVPGFGRHCALLADVNIVAVEGHTDAWRAWRAGADSLKMRDLIAHPASRGVLRLEERGKRGSMVALDMGELGKEVGVGFNAAMDAAWPPDDPSAAVQLQRSAAWRLASRMVGPGGEPYAMELGELAAALREKGMDVDADQLAVALLEGPSGARFLRLEPGGVAVMLVDDLLLQCPEHEVLPRGEAMPPQHAQLVADEPAIQQQATITDFAAQAQAPQQGQERAAQQQEAAGPLPQSPPAPLQQAPTASSQSASRPGLRRLDPNSGSNQPVLTKDGRVLDALLDSLMPAVSTLSRLMPDSHTPHGLAQLTAGHLLMYMSSKHFPSDVPPSKVFLDAQFLVSMRHAMAAADPCMPPPQTTRELLQILMQAPKVFQLQQAESGEWQASLQPSVWRQIQDAQASGAAGSTATPQAASGASAAVTDAAGRSASTAAAGSGSWRSNSGNGGGPSSSAAGSSVDRMPAEAGAAPSSGGGSACAQANPDDWSLGFVTLVAPGLPDLGVLHAAAKFLWEEHGRQQNPWQLPGERAPVAWGVPVKRLGIVLKQRGVQRETRSLTRLLQDYPTLFALRRGPGPISETLVNLSSKMLSIGEEVTTGRVAASTSAAALSQQQQAARSQHSRGAGQAVSDALQQTSAMRPPAASQAQPRGDPATQPHAEPLAVVRTRYATQPASAAPASTPVADAAAVEPRVQAQGCALDAEEAHAATASAPVPPAAPTPAHSGLPSSPPQAPLPFGPNADYAMALTFCSVWPGQSLAAVVRRLAAQALHSRPTGPLGDYSLAASELRQDVVDALRHHSVGGGVLTGFNKHKARALSSITLAQLLEVLRQDGRRIFHIASKHQAFAPGGRLASSGRGDRVAALDVQLNMITLASAKASGDGASTAIQAAWPDTATSRQQRQLMRALASELAEQEMSANHPGVHCMALTDLMRIVTRKYRALGSEYSSPQQLVEQVQRAGGKYLHVWQANNGPKGLMAGLLLVRLLVYLPGSPTDDDLPHVAEEAPPAAAAAPPAPLSRQPSPAQVQQEQQQVANGASRAAAAASSSSNAAAPDGLSFLPAAPVAARMSVWRERTPSPERPSAAPGPEALRQQQQAAAPAPRVMAVQPQVQQAVLPSPTPRAATAHAGAGAAKQAPASPPPPSAASLPSRAAQPEPAAAPPPPPPAAPAPAAPSLSGLTPGAGHGPASLPAPAAQQGTAGQLQRDTSANGEASRPASSLTDRAAAAAAVAASALPARASSPPAVAAMLPRPNIKSITVACDMAHIGMLQHCYSCSHIGVAVKTAAGQPAVMLLYAPATTHRELAAADGGGGGSGGGGAAASWPATVYVVDVLGARLMLGTLVSVLQETSVTKVLYDAQQALEPLRQALFPQPLVVSPVKDVKVLTDMVQAALGGGQAAGQAGSGAGSSSALLAMAFKAQLAGCRLWAEPSQAGLMESLVAKHLAWHEAARAAAAEQQDSAWAARPLDKGRLSEAAAAAAHLPELWEHLCSEMGAVALAASQQRAGNASSAL